MSAVLDPAGLPDVTLRATNFLPSPASEAGPALFVVAVVALAALGGIWWRPKDLRWWLGAAAAVVAAVLALTALGVFRADQPGVRAIVAQSLPTTAKTGAGVVLDGNGSLGELNVSGGRLRVSGLRHAGVHTGKVRLDDKPAKAKVNVRDWWPWALLAIALGVLAGALVHRWFDRDRARARLGLRADTLYARVDEAAAVPGARRNFIPLTRAGVRVAEIRRRLKEDDATTAAEGELDALDAYVQAADTLRRDAGDLDAALGAYRALCAGDEVVAFTVAEDALGFAFDSEDPDAEKTILKRAQEDVAAALELVSTGSDRYARIASFAADVRRVADQENDPVAKAELMTLASEFDALARDVLLADSPKAITDAYAAAREKVKTAPPDVISTPSTQADLAPVWARPGAGAPAARIELRIVAPGHSDAGNVDDLFLVRAVLRTPPATGTDVHWAFGSGEPVTQRIPPSGTGAWIERRYAQAGDYDLRLTGAGGEELASQRLCVGGPSRLARTRSELQARERRFTRIAFALTLASGMSALYVVDPAWGTGEDYVKALLWGAVVGEGVALVGAVVANRFPAAK